MPRTKATAPVINAQLGAAANVIINGDFQIWQRGTSFTAAALNAYLADRWTWSFTSTAVFNISRSATVPTVAQAGRLFPYSILIACATADAAVAAADFIQFTQKIEGYNWAPLAQRPIVLSFWVMSAKTGVHCVSMRNSLGDRSCVMEYTIAAANTWQFVQIPFPASPSAGTWDYTTGVGGWLTFALMCGTNLHTTPGTWQTGNFVATANQVNVADTIGNQFLVTGIDLRPGTAAPTVFESRSFQQELALCQRYCYAYWGGTMGLAASTTIVQTSFLFPVPMRSAPTATAGNSLQTIDWTGASNLNPSSISISQEHVGVTGGEIRFLNFSGLTSGQAVCLQPLAGYSALFSAEL
jgi:hypothetical protein